tara:strand:- start:906 stop:2102 length:1197 start_codon:yes stop_codon:yes gene_type:complete
MNYKICIIGQGIVGFDLAKLFSKKYPTIGYDICNETIDNIKSKDTFTKKKSNSLTDLYVTSNENDIKDCDVYIITVPTPIDKYKKPDLGPLSLATSTVAKMLSKKNIVIYESTFYPGLTNDYCIPMLENRSKMQVNKDFYVGYSPERINIGGVTEKRANDIIKITSGSNKQAGQMINELYKSVIKAGTHLVKNIKIAESAKMLENCQRDVNIALINEFKKTFDKLNIDTLSVLEAASTKWNFIDFEPGLVGGDCIRIDPYYMIYKSKLSKSSSKLIESAREINESMIKYFEKKIISKISEKKFKEKAKILYLGKAYKKNSSTAKNSLNFELGKLLKLKLNVTIYDPLIDKNDSLKNFLKKNKNFFDVIIIAVDHKVLKRINLKILTKDKSLIIRLPYV